MRKTFRRIYVHIVDLSMSRQVKDKVIERVQVAVLSVEPCLFYATLSLSICHLDLSMAPWHAVQPP